MRGTLAYPTPPLTDGGVALRRWEYGDLACIEAASRDRRIPAGTTVPAEYTEEGGREFIERQWGRFDHGEGLSLAIADGSTGEAVGLIVLLHREDPRTVGVGYWVIPEARSRGVASRAVRLLVDWALLLRDVDQVEAIVEPGNEPSVRALRSAGFAHSGESEVDGRVAYRLVRQRV